MVPAVLAACSNGTAGATPSAASAVTRRSKRSSCDSVKARSASASPSATGRWVHTPSRRSDGSPVTAATTAESSSGGVPTRCIPVSTFTWTATRRPAAAAAAANWAIPSRVERGRQPVRQRGVDRLGPALAEEEYRRLHVVLAQLHPLVDQRHGQAGRPAGDGRPRHRGAPVAVAVRLDHRAQLGRRRQARQDRGVVGDRRQVDLGPGRARPALGHRHLYVLGLPERGDELRRRAVSHRPHPPHPTAPGPPAPAGPPPPAPRGGRATPPGRARGPPARPPAGPARPGRRRRR